MSVLEKQALITEIDIALNDIRPHLAVDGGDIEVVDVTSDNIVHIIWKGNCQICRFSDMTMKTGVETVIKNKYGFIKEVIAVDEIPTS